MESENHLFEKENHLPNLHFWVPFWFSWSSLKTVSINMRATSQWLLCRPSSRMARSYPQSPISFAAADTLNFFLNMFIHYVRLCRFDCFLWQGLQKHPPSYIYLNLNIYIYIIIYMYISNLLPQGPRTPGTQQLVVFSLQNIASWIGNQGTLPLHIYLSSIDHLWSPNILQSCAKYGHRRRT